MRLSGRPPHAGGFRASSAYVSHVSCCVSFSSVSGESEHTLGREVWASVLVAACVCFTMNL